MAANTSALGWLTGAAFVTSLLALGVFAGGVIGRWTAHPAGMGWDQLASVLGGVIIGTLAGAVTAALTVRSLTPRARMVAATAALLVTIALVLYLMALPRRGV
jgi:hypothetical protein